MSPRLFPRAPSGAGRLPAKPGRARRSPVRQELGKGKVGHRHDTTQGDAADACNSFCFPTPSVCSAGTITVHLQKDSRGHLSLVASPLQEKREKQESFKASGGPAAVAIWQKLQQTTSGAGPLAQWQHAQLAHALQER